MFLGNIIIVIQSRTYFSGVSEDISCNYILNILSILSNAKTYSPMSQVVMFSKENTVSSIRDMIVFDLFCTIFMEGN